MKISFFKNWYIHIWEDLSYTPPHTEEGVTTPPIWHPDCLFSVDTPFDPDAQSITFDPVTEEYAIENLPPPPPKTLSEVRREIGDIIVRDAFEWNPHAQMADVVSAIMGIAYLLTQSHGKANVRAALWQLPHTMEIVSGIRVQEGLSAYDLSFLD